jgi:hypothetical protein
VNCLARLLRANVPGQARIAVHNLDFDIVRLSGSQLAICGQTLPHSFPQFLLVEVSDESVGLHPEVHDLTLERYAFRWHANERAPRRASTVLTRRVALSTISAARRRFPVAIGVWREIGRRRDRRQLCLKLRLIRRTRQSPTVAAFSGSRTVLVRGNPCRTTTFKTSQDSSTSTASTWPAQRSRNRTRQPRCSSEMLVATCSASSAQN